MTESDDQANPAEGRPDSEEANEGELHEQAATGKEPEVEFGAGEGPAEADTAGSLDVEPGPGGYAGRDPKTDMPRIPSVPETQDDAKSHDATPPAEGEEREGSE